jgi:RNA polymerase sigma-70 factor (ECF subfamily)
MVGSFEDSEDLVQETFLRGWRRRDTFQGRATFRAWLYRIATNACLDFLARHPVTRQVAPVLDPGVTPVPAVAISWLQPYPDRLLEPAVSSETEPDAMVVARETIELAFMVAVQYLPPRQRAVLILRDVLGWPASETAAALEVSEPSANSALQRARLTLKKYLPPRRTEWTTTANPTDDERELLRRFMEAITRADDAAIGKMLAEHARCGHQPGAGGHMAEEPIWYEGRDTLLAAWAPALHGPHSVDSRYLLTAANRQPAAAMYIRGSGDREYRAFALDVYRIEDGQVAEVVAFTPDIFPVFGVPPTL